MVACSAKKAKYDQLPVAEYMRIAQLLVDAGADIHARDVNGKTALDLANDEFRTFKGRKKFPRAEFKKLLKWIEAQS